MWLLVDIFAIPGVHVCSGSPCPVGLKLLCEWFSVGTLPISQVTINQMVASMHC